ncbi:37S ribosomal protein Rsm25 [Annulohypoxylon maeteangense]|uniref:37S ribosomal protein Rsm25 n=1 Tax=Annulohypoxylon maeteangense TaxID=1927788 RepID=UPI0020087852|nr:37S ribosomal protein Rsm25 [Annulohypoxylon maeteangense]KAI0884626.1 37S ribosomal protein Rsm25 [Annulohypoxylon maeteangense]
MGGQRQIKPRQVYQTMTNLLNHRIFPVAKVQQPVWYKVVESIPPPEILIRTLPPQHREPNPKMRKPSKIFKPQQITYEEDGLRKTFFKDHPWELARPRMIIEMDGKDARRYDWSKGLRQPGMPLCGECVVQYQMWMMHNIPGITKEEAYDKARHEFYGLRQEEEIERRIAKEEAQMVGAYFGKTFIRVGLDLEDDQFERWKKWASKQIESVQAERDAAYTSFGVDEDANVDDIDLDEEMGINEDVEKPPPE